MKKKVLIILLSLLFIYCIGGVVYSLLIGDKSSTVDKEVSIIEVNDYKIDEKKVSNLYKQEFEILKNNLESSQIDYNEYAKSIAKLYIIDLYSLNDKLNKYDVTSSQYVYNNSQENFELKVSETLYKYLEDNNDGEREQVLASVTEVNIQSIEESLYAIDSNEYKSYNIVINWNYDKELGYDTSAVLTLINVDNKISVFEHRKVSVSENEEIIQ